MNIKTAGELEGFSILIVDDEPKNIQLLGSILKQNGYQVEFATDGEKALDWLNNKNFDLVMLDVMMPGLNGYEVCERIKANKQMMHIPVIFLTAKTETEDIVKGFEVGGTDYITKPFRTPELLARVKTHVEIKTLRGLIPICASCKKVRDDDEGLWQKLEAYIEKYSYAHFSHGLCEECFEKLYSHQPWYNRSKAKKGK
nr:response regulator [uncultured Desulfobacter sp.]